MTRFPTIPKPASILSREAGAAASLFLASKSIQDVADALEVHPGHLKRWLYEWPGHGGYSTFCIAKKSAGLRMISAPPPPIKILQQKFRGILNHTYIPKDCAFGFISGRSIVDGARRHKKRSQWILNLDLQDFYPSINFGRVRGLFMSFGVGQKAASIWAHLVTCKGVLPQGAPTSPVISNMIARQLDRKMIDLSRTYHLKYTRYADDLSLSTTKGTFPADLALLGGTGLEADHVTLQPILLAVIAGSGFSLNRKKTRLYSRAVRQEITGLTVNEFVNVRRTFLRQIRAMIHAARKFGFDDAGREYMRKYARKKRMPPEVLGGDEFDAGKYFRSVIYGKLDFVRMVRGKRDKCYVNLCLTMNELDPGPPKSIAEVKRMHEEFDVFISHASEDTAHVAQPLHDELVRIEVSAFIDVEHIDWGDSFVKNINDALSCAKIVVVVLSKNSIGKAWPLKEVYAALAREVEGRTKILPLVVGPDDEIDGILDKLPLLKDKRFKKWSNAPANVAAEIKKELSRLQKPHPTLS